MINSLSFLTLSSPWDWSSILTCMKITRLLESVSEMRLFSGPSNLLSTLLFYCSRSALSTCCCHLSSSSGSLSLSFTLFSLCLILSDSQPTFVLATFWWFAEFSLLLNWLSFRVFSSCLCSGHGQGFNLDPIFIFVIFSSFPLPVSVFPLRSLSSGRTSASC